MKNLQIQDRKHKMLTFRIKEKKWVIVVIHYYITFKK
jgi:hypothetical protein